ncbi:hypothetical protein GCM10027055_12530 [Janibacter alkaliphilus]|uniref:Lipoprotein signal peptidase n=1 Tax=Janibacter alkaliphilus TaxID=1069963 RepID=A0A852XGT9_9MICO|nr:signal peptidase II [Janibacter alkaliphilus]
MLDQLTKLWALATLDDGRTIELLGDWLGLRLLRNSGAAFSLGGSMTWVMTLVAVVVTIGIVVVARRLGSARWGLALGMVLGGSLGNLVDRFFREPGGGSGHVIDFIDYLDLFVGNVADIGIVLGAGLALWLSLRDVALDGRPVRHAADRGAEREAERGEHDG